MHRTVLGLSHGVASRYAGHMTPILIDGFAEIIGTGISEMLRLTRERMIELAEANQLPQDLDALSNETWQITNNIAMTVASLHLENSPMALVKGVAEMVDKGIDEARAIARAGLVIMATHDQISDITNLDMNEVLSLGYMQSQVEDGRQRFIPGKFMLIVGTLGYEWNEAFQGYFSFQGMPKILLEGQYNAEDDKC